MGIYDQEFLDEHAVADALYGDTQHRDTNLNDPTSDLSQSLSEIESANQSWRNSLRAVQVSEAQGRELTALVQRYKTTPATAEEADAWRKETSQSLGGQYGAEKAREKMELARSLAARDSKFMATLKKANLLTHPAVLRIFIERSHSLRAIGKL